MGVEIQKKLPIDLIQMSRLVQKMKTILLKNCREVVHSADGRPKVGADLSIVETLNEVRMSHTM